MFFFIFGQLASLLEIIIVLHFLISFFKWKDDILYRKTIITGISIVLFMVAQLNGDFRCSHFVVVLLDGIILIVFCRLFFKRNTTNTDFGMYYTASDCYHVQYSCYAVYSFISKYRCAGIYENTGS